MIGQHPDLVGLPELKLFCYGTLGELGASLPRYWSERGVKHRSPGLVRAIAQFEFGSQDSDAIDAAQVWLLERADWSGPDVLDFLMEHASPCATVEKSPENVESDVSLERLVSAYPRARYLHLTRHPVTTQRSLEKHWSRTIPGHPTEGQPMAGIFAWVDVQCRILRLAERLPKEQYMRVRAEDVLNATRPQLHAIARWLGVRTDEHALEAMMHPEACPFARFGNEGSGILGGNDPSFMRDPVPHPVEILPTIDCPQGWAGNAELWRMTVDVGHWLGYP